MKMRELEGRTGVRREMIHFYFRNDLLPEPERPKPNVALYSEEHVRAIQTLRRLQTEQRMSIAEIKQAMAGSAPQGSDRDVAAIQHLDTLFALRAGADMQLVALDSLLERNPQALSDAQKFEQMGAIELHRKNGEVRLTRIDAQVVGIWGDMRRSGFTEEAGFDTSIIAMYHEAAEQLARKEIDIFVSAVGEDVPVEKRADMAETASRLMLSAFTVLRMKAEVEAFRLAEYRDPRQEYKRQLGERVKGRTAA